MTQGELKFSLQVEMMLNPIPQPEYRILYGIVMIRNMFVILPIDDPGWTQVWPSSWDDVESYPSAGVLYIVWPCND